MTSKIDEAIDAATGANEHNMRRDRPYAGQPWTEGGARGKTEIKGVTFRDLNDCFLRAIFQVTSRYNPTLYKESEKGEHACLCWNDAFQMKGWDEIDPLALAQNLSCEVERAMGIFPNILGLSLKETMRDVPIIGSIDKDGNFETSP